MLFPQVIDLRRHLVVVLRALQGRSIETTGTEFAVIQLHFEADSFKTNLSLKSTHCNIHIAKVLPNHNFRMLSLCRICPACTNDWSLLTVESSTHGIRTEWPETKESRKWTNPDLRIFAHICGFLRIFAYFLRIILDGFFHFFSAKRLKQTKTCRFSHPYSFLKASGWTDFSKLTVEGFQHILPCGRNHQLLLWCK